jgi:hypothetical protein
MPDPATVAAPPALDPFQHLVQISTGYMLSSALYTAVALDIADRLADGAKPVAELARTAGVNEDACTVCSGRWPWLASFTRWSHDASA